MPVSNATADLGRTVRQRIVDQLEAKLEAMQDGGEDVWRKVYRGDLDDVDNVVTPCISIDAGTEEMTGTTFPCDDYVLPIIFQFRFRGERGQDELDVYQYYLGLVQYAMLQDHTLGGTSYDVKEISNSHTIVGVEGVYPGGSLVTEVNYRTRTHNPYKTPSEAP